MTNTYQDYFDLLRFKESSVFPVGCRTMIRRIDMVILENISLVRRAFDLGYYSLDNSDRNLFRNDWMGNWSGKNSS